MSQRARIWADVYVAPGTTQEQLVQLTQTGATLLRTAASRTAEVESDLAPDASFGAHVHESSDAYACSECRQMGSDGLNSENIEDE